MISPQSLPNGYQHIALTHVSSTNTVALEYGKHSALNKLWITAEQQLQGKGSRGRSWISQPGNLYASLLLCRSMPSDELVTLTFVASLAVYEAVAYFVPKDLLALKWPNDLLLNRAKVSGILLENHALGKRDAAVIIGFGVNCQCNPQNSDYAATNIQAAGIFVKPSSIFQRLVVEMDRWLDVWDNGAHFSTIRQQWLERAVGVGQDIIVKTQKACMQGIFVDINQDGYLILKISDGTCHAISTADIFFSDNNEKKYMSDE